MSEVKNCVLLSEIEAEQIKKLLHRLYYETRNPQVEEIAFKYIGILRYKLNTMRGVK